MSASDPPQAVYDTIVLPTDGSEAAADAGRHAFSHGDRYDATVHVLSVVELAGGLGPGDRDEAAIDRRREERVAAVDDLAETAPSSVDVETAVKVGSPSRVISEYAVEVDADLVVMSTHARSGAGRFLFGSITERVIRDGDVPVLAVQR
jgi:nucleotide-binding universal stress UspA family protein